jgi:hypothetical protein
MARWSRQEDARLLNEDELVRLRLRLSAPAEVEQEEIRSQITQFSLTEVILI